ncbi:T9SS type B sorting domain-containing protein [Puteibacter caeruleilacunae]|nr:T9SS type B sorting domain-containing protein [Puteibacter caeruleilacunae]
MRSTLKHIILIASMLFGTVWDTYVCAQTEASILIYEGKTQTFSVTKVEGYQYHWWVTSPGGLIEQDFPFSVNNSVSIRWNDQGNFRLHVQAMDANGCLSEIQQYPIDVKAAENINWLAVNDHGYAFTEGTAVGNVLTNDYDPFLNRNWTIELVDGPDQGTLTFNTDYTDPDFGSYTFNAAGLAPGQYVFTYRLCDRDEPTITACPTATVEINILDPNDETVNQAPVAGFDSYYVIAGNSVTGNLTYNDIDIDDTGKSNLKISNASSVTAQNGSVNVTTNGAFTYTPRSGFVNDVDTIFYEVCDSQGLCHNDTAIVYVAPAPSSTANYRPFTGDAAMISHGGIATGELANIASSPIGESLSYAVSTNVQHGSLTLSPTGSVEYIPDMNFRGIDYFIYEVTDANGITHKGTVYIIVDPIEVIADAGDDITVCFTDLPVMLNGTASSQGSDFTYLWSPLDHITNGTSLTPEYTPPGIGMSTLQLTVTHTPTGETDTDEVTVTVLEGPTADAGPDQEIFEGVTADLDGSQSTGMMPMTYEWTTNDGNFDIPPAANDPKARVDAVGTYILTVTDNDGCRNTDEMKVALRVPGDIDIVNGFTPNGDGTNDVFIIDGIDDYPVNTVMIFNRWGTKVYQGANYDNKEVVWDGTVNTGAMTIGSGQLPTGTYFYIVTLNGEKVGFSGWVYLDR